MLFLIDVDHGSFEKAKETRQINLQAATVSLQVVISLCKRKETAALKLSFKTTVLQNAYRMADTRLAKTHVPGKINRTNHALLLLEYQHSLQIILPGRMNLHRSLLLGGKLLFCVPHGSVLSILC